MAEGDTPEVRTPFVVLDKTSPKIKEMVKQGAKLEKVYADAQKRMHAVARAEGRVPDVLTPQQAVAEQGRKRRAEQARLNEEKREVKRQRFSAEVARAGAELFGSQANIVAERLGGFGQALRAAGMDLTEAGSALGPKFAKAGVAAAAAAAALDVGFRVGTALDEVLGLSDSIAGVNSTSGKVDYTMGEVAQEFARTLTGLDEVGKGISKAERAQLNYVQALGYQSVAQHRAATAVQTRQMHEVRLAKAEEDAAKGLAALPTNATIEQMDAWNDQLRQAGVRIMQATGAAADELPSIMSAIQAAAEKNVAATERRALDEQLLDRAIREEAKTVYALPLDASVEAISQHNAALFQHVRSIIAATGASDQEAAAIYSSLEARVNERGSLSEAMLETRRNAEQMIRMDAAVAEQVKALRGMPTGTLAERMAALDRVMMAATQSYYKVATEYNPRLFATLYDKIADKVAPPKKMSPVYDFRGSRFAIEQKFSPGFDVDRVGVALVDQIAELGERRVQSGFAPLFTVR